MAAFKCPVCKLTFGRRFDHRLMCEHLRECGVLVIKNTIGLECVACGFYDQYYSEKLHHVKNTDHDWVKAITLFALEQMQ